MYTPLKTHQTSNIIGWSFRQILFLGCFPVFPAISAPDEIIVYYLPERKDRGMDGDLLILVLYDHVRGVGTSLTHLKVS